MSVPETRFARAASAPPRSELERLRATCRRQAIAIDTLRAAVLRFSTATRALKAENAELRGEAERLRSGPAAGRDRVEGAELVEMPVAAGLGAAHAARVVIQRCLDGVVAPPVLADALLLVSELVTNSVRHSGVAEGEELLLRVHVWRGICRLEVEDPGCVGAIAPLPPCHEDGSKMGLNLVQMLSDRWGVVRAAGGPTRVWVQLPCERATA